MRLMLFVVMLFAPLLTLSAQARAAKLLTVYFIDVEGGQATLFVSPSGESLLVDTGWRVPSHESPGPDARDAKRIVAAAHLAGLSRIDYVLFTHYHIDHVGGAPQLASLIPIGTFIDHGPLRELTDPPTTYGYNAYQKLLASGTYKHIVAKPGDKLPIAGIDASVISADGKLIAQPLPGAGSENPACKLSSPRPADQTENARSLGIEISFGKLKILDLGDLTWDKEMQLMCPVNKLGTVDILVVSHHGWYQSSSPALVEAIHPRVAIMDNGANKGGSIPTFKTLAAATDLSGKPTQLWQLHYSNEAKDLNRPEGFIANPPGPDAGDFIKLTASPSGRFVLLNSRTGVAATYKAERE